MKKEIQVPKNFIKNIIMQDLKEGRVEKIITRFPPEPNGYLHIGHAKAICLNFGLAEEFNGRCHLRFDDTNPTKEDDKFVQAIKQDVRWLGFDWGKHLYFASDYFDKLFEFAVELIKKNKAYVCDLSPEEIKKYRGTLTEPGIESPYRNRSIEENLDLFYRMKNGEFEEGSRVLRAKIDMKSPNINMRDPVIYRIIKRPHHRTKNKWCIYPTYDFAHCLSDAIENITHSLCSLEFEDHRPLYEWFINELIKKEPKPKQIEFARLNLSYTVLSKRKLIQLVEKGIVNGWDDPRMPTIAGLRRRGFTPKSIRRFCELIGVGKSESMVDIGLLEYAIREDLNKIAPRRMGVLDPVKVVIVNYPEDKEEYLDAINNPEDLSQGTRKIPFSRELFIEREDFLEDPPKKFYRLAPGREVRLRYAYFIKCVDLKKDKNGNIKEIYCTYDPETRGGNAKDGRKVKATLHWVSAKHAFSAELRLYDRLFIKPDPTAEEKKGIDFKEYINPDSLKIITHCKLEPSLKDVQPGDRFQFERKGYFCVDPDSTYDKLIFNLIVPLRDRWAKMAKK
ncbi:glutamine--tRNA ligase/YqeY domain fusion protein [Desulfothermus naphthae]